MVARSDDGARKRTKEEKLFTIDGLRWTIGQVTILRAGTPTSRQHRILDILDGARPVSTG